MIRSQPLRVSLSLLLMAVLAACAGHDVRQEAAVVPVEAHAPATTSPAQRQAQGDPAPTLDATTAADQSQAPVRADAAEAPRQDLPAGQEAPAQSVPTQAELDYTALYGAALYGAQDYDPVADPTLPPPADLPSSYDPWEKLNRRVHAFNNVVDRRVAKPLAKAYVALVPRPVRLGVGNFFNNLGQPIGAINALLQGKPLQATQALGRFALNSTLGIGGIFDPATDAHLPNRSEDFGQTLGVWGWEQSRYVELPLFGPRTVRDVLGLIGDAPLSPIRQVNSDPIRVFLQGLQLVDVRTQLFAVDSMREGATDEYALFRDAWLQRRKYQIFGDQQKRDDSLPEYLRDDTGNPIVPADAMPIMPTDSY